MRVVIVFFKRWLWLSPSYIILYGHFDVHDDCNKYIRRLVVFHAMHIKILNNKEEELTGRVSIMVYCPPSFPQIFINNLSPGTKKQMYISWAPSVTFPW